MLLALSLHHVFDVPHGGEPLLPRVPVVPVEIPRGEGAPVVADYHAVGVDHGDDLEDEFIPQVLRTERKINFKAGRIP